MSIYDFSVKLDNGDVYSLEKYQGKVLVIVNTATKCGLAPQFEALETLYQTYKEQGLMVLGFPSNQFKQELATSEEAAAACRLTYGVSFPMHELIAVNGAETAPLFDYLKSEAPGTLGQAIKWNFTKFLVDREGRVIERFAPQTTPEKMVPAIEKALRQ